MSGACDYKNYSLPVGARLHGANNEYVIEKFLGSGAFGMTYLATTEVEFEGSLGKIKTKVRVAIKEFFMKDYNGRSGNIVTQTGVGKTYERYKRKFEKEALSLSRLRHPNIVKVLESFQENNTIYYSMEYLEGGSLNEWLMNHGALSEQEAMKCISQTASALSYMHGNNMLHLDVNPKNIMLDSKGNYIVIDFGISKQYDENGNPVSSIATIGAGTPGFAPVEQMDYREKKQIPVTMDVYALGATLFMLLTGKCPPVASEVLSSGLPLSELKAKGTSQHCIDCIKTAMNPLPNGRYQTVVDLTNALCKGTPSVVTDLYEDFNTWYDEAETDIRQLDEPIPVDIDADFPSETEPEQPDKKAFIATYSLKSIVTGWIITGLLFFGMLFMGNCDLYLPTSKKLLVLILFAFFLGSFAFWIIKELVKAGIEPAYLRVLGVGLHIITSIFVYESFKSGDDGVFIMFEIVASMIVGYSFMIKYEEDNIKNTPRRFLHSTVYTGVVVACALIILTSLANRVWVGLGLSPNLLLFVAIAVISFVFILDNFIKSTEALVLCRVFMLALFLINCALLYDSWFFIYSSSFIAIIAGFSFMMSLNGVQEEHK